MWTPSRSRLPAIGQRTERKSPALSESQVGHNQLETSTTADFATQEIVAVNQMKGGASFSGGKGAASVSPLNEFSSSRLLHLESRMNANEQSYRGVLEELVRLQEELRAAVRRNDDRWREERKDRFQLREGLQVTVEKLNELLKKVDKTEDRADVDRRGLRSFAQHLQKIDMMVVEKQKLSEAKQEQQKIWNDRFSQHIDNIREEGMQFQQQVDSKTESVGAEIKQWKAVCMARKSELDEWLTRITQSLEHTELEQKDLSEAIRYLQGKQNRVELTVSKMRDRLESRWNDLGGVLREMRRSVQETDLDRESQEEQLRQRVAAVEQNVLLHAGQNQEAVRALNKLLEDTKLESEATQKTVNEQFGALAEELNKRLLDSETKMKGDVNSQVTHIESTLKGEIGLQFGLSKEQQTHIEQQLETLNRKVDDQVAAVRNGLKVDRMQVSQSLNQLQEALSLIESQADVHSDNLKQVIIAEVKTRHRELDQLQQQCSELQERMNSALSQLSQSFATVSSQMTDIGQQVQSELKKRLADSQEQNTRRLGDVEIRISSLGDQISRLAESNTTHIEEMQHKIKDSQQSELSSITHSHTLNQNRVKELQSQVSSLSYQVAENVERLQLLKVDMNGRLEAEKQLRMQEGRTLIRELGTKVNQDAFQQMNGDAGSRVTEMDGKLAQVVSQVVELETGLHSLKLDLNGRLSSEAAMRMEMVLGSNERLTKVESHLAQLEFLVHHQTDISSDRILQLPDNHSSHTELKHELSNSHEHIDNEIGMTEEERRMSERQMSELFNNTVESQMSSHEDIVGQTNTEGELNDKTTEGLSDDHEHSEGGLQQRESSQENLFENASPNVAERVDGREEHSDLPNSLERQESFQQYNS